MKLTGYINSQSFTLHHKTKRSAKCYGRNCQTIFIAGALCFRIEGVLTVPHSKSDAVEQLFYFCARRKCIESAPVWSNVKYPNNFRASNEVSQVETDNTALDLGIASLLST